MRRGKCGEANERPLLRRGGLEASGLLALASSTGPTRNFTSKAQRGAKARNRNSAGGSARRQRGCCGGAART
jgi:hypothetical protein